MTSGDTDITSTSEQEIRAKLRESFLRAVSELNGERCRVLTYEQSTLQATFAGWKPDGSEILVRELQTPASVEIDAALLRSPDVLAIQFERPLELP